MTDKKPHPIREPLDTFERAVAFAIRRAVERKMRDVRDKAA